jgi:hypothetical protein
MMTLKVHKFNNIDWKQERCLVITEKNVYNFKGKSKPLIINHFAEMRRKIPFEKLGGITISKHPES